MNRRGSLRPLNTQSSLVGCLLAVTYLCFIAGIAGTAWKFRAESQKLLGSGPDMLLGLGFTSVGILFLIVTANDVGWWWLSRRWTRAVATIVSSRVDKSGEGPNLPKITYTFEVMGKQFESDCVRFGGYGHGDAEFLVEFCFPGRSVNVYYDPANPQRCCLQRIVGEWLVMHLTGFFFAALGTVFLVLRL